MRARAEWGAIFLAEVVVDGADGDGVAVVGYVGVVVVGEQEEVVAAGFSGGEEEACDFPFAGFVVLNVVGHLDDQKRSSLN